MNWRLAMTMSRHHILFEASAYNSRPEARALRTTHSLIPRIDRDIHDDLHTFCPSVPLLGSQALLKVCEYFNPTGDTMRDMDGLMSAIERSTRSRSFHPLERDLGGLAIESIETQRPYIEKGLTR